MCLYPKYFRDNTTGVAQRYLRWDEISISVFRDFCESFRPNSNWTVRVENHQMSFYKGATAQGSMAPGDWVKLDTWTDTDYSPDIMSDSSLRSGKTEIFQN